MILRMVFAACVAILAAGCLSVNARRQPFTKAWTDQVRGRPELDRRAAVEVKSLEPRRPGPDTITHDEAGRVQTETGGARGIGSDVQIKSGLSTRIRYNYESNLEKPRRRR